MVCFIVAAIVIVIVLQRESTVDALYKPMIVHHQTVYGHYGDTPQLPTDAVGIGRITHSLNDSGKRVYKTDAELSNNCCYAEGTEVYEKGTTLYIPVDKDVYDVLIPLDDQ